MSLVDWLARWEGATVRARAGTFSGHAVSPRPEFSISKVLFPLAPTTPPKMRLSELRSGRLYHLYYSPSRNLSPNEKQIRNQLQLLVALQRTEGICRGRGFFYFLFESQGRHPRYIYSNTCAYMRVIMRASATDP